MMKRTLLLMALLLPSAAPAQDTAHLEERERAAIDRALERGLEWLRAQQAEEGAWHSARRSGICPVSLTAMALWASAEVSRAEEVGDPESRATAFLLANRRPGGGIYAEGRGLRIYTSGVAARALEAENRRSGSAEVLAAAREAGLFAYRGGVPESWVDDLGADQAARGDLAERAGQILESATGLSEGERRALEFLRRQDPGAGPLRPPQRVRDPRWELPGPEDQALSYEDVLPLVYAELRPEQQLARRALLALKSWYTLEENPDLTRRWTTSGFHQPEQGLYYYYLTLARVLTAYHTPRLALDDGTTRDWPRELSRKLIKLQREDGSWVNETARWWEGEPVLTTSYALLALRLCRDAPPPATASGG